MPKINNYVGDGLRWIIKWEVIMFTASLVVYKYIFERLLEEHVNILLKTSFATVINIYLFLDWFKQ